MEEDQHLLEEGPPDYDDDDEPLPTYIDHMEPKVSRDFDKEDAWIFFFLGIFLNILALCLYANTTIRRRAVFCGSLISMLTVIIWAVYTHYAIVALSITGGFFLSFGAFANTFRVNYMPG